jgi:acylphosphatase
MNDMTEIYIQVFGKVQGVNFRDNTKKMADKLGLIGYVQNMDSGAVEVLAQGPEDKLFKFLEWISKGPVGSQVKEVEYVFRNPFTAYKGFEIRG